MVPFRCSLFTESQFRRGCATVVLTLCLTAGLMAYRAHAMTAEDVLKKMNHDQRFSYLTGLIDMLAYQTAASGNRDKGNCIINAFFREQKEASWRKLNEVLEQYTDKRTEILVTVLANQLCKK